MNREQYNSNCRYAKVLEKMDLLGIMDVSTTRQAKNGTIVWKLPIKYSTHPKFIEVASFATGYVRNQNGGYTNYQLNKRCDSEPQYYPDHEWKTLGNGDYTQVKTGKYRKYTTRTCKLIPNEIDRLEYLIAYCLKNYYIKNANQVINGDYIPKWSHEYDLKRLKDKHSDELDSRHVYACGHYDRIQDLEVEVELLQEQLTSEKLLSNERLANEKLQIQNKLNLLHDELADMTTARDYYKNSYDDLELSIIVNGQKYKVM